MSSPANPTSYRDVNEVLQAFNTRIQDILGSSFVGMYLYGSLALGDFDAQTSDIDFLVATAAEIPDDLFFALQEMHAQFNRSASPWAGKVEAAYIPVEALRRPSPVTGHYPQIEGGNQLTRQPLETGWAFQFHTLRKHGIVVSGPDPQTLAAPVDLREMVRAVIAMTGTWLEQASHDLDWLAWLRWRPNQSFVVLTLCRSLYFLETGDTISKPAGAYWAQKELGRPWEALIERSLEGQHADQETTSGDLDATIAMIDFTYRLFSSH